METYWLKTDVEDRTNDYEGQSKSLLSYCINIVTDFLKASLWRQITVLGARKPSDCTTVKDRFYTTETLAHLYNNTGVSSLDNEFARRVSVTTKDIESVLVSS
jgi:hypothetical protein